MIDYTNARFTLRMIGLGPGKLSDMQALATLYLMGRISDDSIAVQEFDNPARLPGFSDEELLQHAVNALVILRNESQTDEDVRPSAVRTLAFRIRIMTAVLGTKGHKAPPPPPIRRTTKAMLLTGDAADMLVFLETRTSDPAVEAFLVEKGFWS